MTAYTLMSLYYTQADKRLLIWNCWCEQKLSLSILLSFNVSFSKQQQFWRSWTKDSGLTSRNSAKLIDYNLNVLISLIFKNITQHKSLKKEERFFKFDLNVEKNVDEKQNKNRLNNYDESWRFDSWKKNEQNSMIYGLKLVENIGKNQVKLQYI